MMKKLLLKCCIVVSTFCAALSANASLLVFTDRIAWQAAAGGSGDLFQDFNSYTSDVIYSSSNPVTAGFLTLSVTSAVSDASWRIDAMPAEFASIPDVNGSTFATTLGTPQGWNTLLSFTSATVFGFDYAGASYSTANGTLTTSRGDSVTLATSGNSARSFIGLLYNEGETFSSLTWSSSGQFAAGMDNVEAFSSQSHQVPVPATMLLLGSGIAGLAGIGLRRKKP